MHRFLRKMKANPVLFLLCILLCMVCTCQKIEKVTAVLQQTSEVTLRCDHHSTGVMKCTHNDELVLQCEVDHCDVGHGFKKRVQIAKNCDLIISPLQYNDQGFYVCTCGDRIFYYSLVILVPRVVNVSAGESAVLPCYADTKASRNPYNLWEKVDKERRIQVLQFKNRNFFYEPKLKGRVWASEDGYSTGDYSMHITKALPSDHGLYLCQYAETEDSDLFRGGPNSVLLNVQGETQSSSTTNVIICIVALVGVILVVVIVVLTCLSKRHSNEVRMGALAGQGDGVQREETGVPSDTTQAEQPTEATALFVPEVDESQLSVPLTETSSHSPLPFREKESVSVGVDMP